MAGNGWMEGRRVSGQTPIDPPEPAAMRWLLPQARLRRRGLVRSDPLWHRHQLRSSTVQGQELSLDADGPQTFDGEIVPPASGRARSTSTSPNDLTPSFASTTCPHQLRGHWGATKAPISLSTGGEAVGPRSSYAILTRPQGASRGDVTCTYRAFRWQPRPSRGEARG
jgi:hypothetical protein